MVVKVIIFVNLFIAISLFSFAQSKKSKPLYDSLIYVYEINGSLMTLGKPGWMIWFSHHDLLRGKKYYKPSLIKMVRRSLGFPTAVSIERAAKRAEWHPRSNSRCCDTLFFRDIVLRCPMEIIGATALRKNVINLYDSVRFVKDDKGNGKYVFYIKNKE